MKSKDAPQATVADDEVVAALTLARSPHIGSIAKVEILRRAGTFQKALARLPGGVSSGPRRQAEEEWRDCRRLGFSVVTFGTRPYPALLADIADPPLALYVWGRLDPADELSLAVVGSRRATPYGTEVCERLSEDLAGRGLTIVSGLARGIDATAHRSALRVDGRTIAVLGSGLDVIYPKEHRRLAERIAERSAVVSELPLKMPPLAGHFPRRNRIVAGLALGTLVIEATERSGSLISARCAVDENREVFAVPGPIHSPNSRGVHRLIQQGAKLVQEPDDIIEELRPDVRERLSHQTANPRELSKELGTLEDDEHRILELLRDRGAVDADRLVGASRLPAHRVTAALVGLELKGWVRVFAGGVYGETKPR